MSFLLSNRKPKQDTQGLLTELFFAAHGVAKYLGFNTDSGHQCVCGPLPGSPENPLAHTKHCPVGRLYAAINAVDKAVL
jgi:hypothetical protein